MGGQQVVDGGPGRGAVAEVGAGQGTQLGVGGAGEQTAPGEPVEGGEGVAGRPCGVHERGRVEEPGRRHALGPPCGVLVQFLLGEPLPGRRDVAGAATAAPPGLVEDGEPEGMALLVGGVLVAGEFLARLGHEGPCGVRPGQGRDVVDVRLGQQVAQAAGAARDGQQGRQACRVLVGFAALVQPARGGARPVVLVQGGEGGRHDGPRQVPADVPVGEQRPHRVGTGPLPHPYQRVLLGHAPDLDGGQRAAHQLRVAAAEQRREPGARHLAGGVRQFGPECRVHRHLVEPVGEGAAQGGGGALVAVDGGADRGVTGAEQPGQHPGVQPRVPGEGGTHTGVAVCDDGGGERGSRQGAAGQQVLQRPVGQRGQCGGGGLGCRVFQQQGEGGGDAAGLGGRVCPGAAGGAGAGTAASRAGRVPR